MDMTVEQMKSLLKFYDSEAGEVTDLNNPNCSYCNECCSGATLLTDEEFKSLSKYFKTKEGRKILKDAKKRHNKLQNENNATSLICPFSSKNKKCLIYSRRPRICRGFHCKESLQTKEYDKSIYNVLGTHKVIFHLFDVIGGVNE